MTITDLFLHKLWRLCFISISQTFCSPSPHSHIQPSTFYPLCVLHSLINPQKATRSSLIKRHSSLIRFLSEVENTSSCLNSSQRITSLRIPCRLHNQIGLSLCMMVIFKNFSSVLKGLLWGFPQRQPFTIHWPWQALIHFHFSTLAVERGEMWVFMKACFVHEATALGMSSSWRTEWKKEHSHIGGERRVSVGGGGTYGWGESWELVTGPSFFNYWQGQQPTSSLFRGQILGRVPWLPRRERGHLTPGRESLTDPLWDDSAREKSVSGTEAWYLSGFSGSEGRSPFE